MPSPVGLPVRRPAAGGGIDRQPDERSDYATGMLTDGDLASRLGGAGYTEAAGDPVAVLCAPFVCLSTPGIVMRSPFIVWRL